MEEEGLVTAAGIRTDELMPKHVAVIMDGNRRWAMERGLSPLHGYKAGWKSFNNLICLCRKWGVQVVTVFAFSTENWTRPQEEVDHLMAFFEEVLKTNLDDMMRNGVRQTVIGNKSMLPKSLQETISHTEEATMTNSKFQVNYMINYSGRFDIIQACKSIANKVKDGVILPVDISEDLVQEELQTKHSDPSSPDLLIRTSGELRLSNFMLWQLAYTQLFFTEKLFPDFEESDLLDAFNSFSKTKQM